MQRRLLLPVRSKKRGISRTLVLGGTGMLLVSGVVAACGPAPQPTTSPSAGTSAPVMSAAPKPPVTSKPVEPVSEYNPCKDKPPISMEYTGVLRAAKCDDERFPIMADVATMLGVDCRYCHVPHPSDPKKELYPVMTAKKQIANWMRGNLMEAIKPADGSKLQCKHCHVDKNGKPVAKILGEPRDQVAAHEWMSLVMTTKFVVAKTGEKLKCKHCHVGNYSTPEWQSKVILTDHIPK